MAKPNSVRTQICFMRMFEGSRDAPPSMHVSLPEDCVVGLTMHLQGVALHARGCFHFWGPCDVFNAVKDCVNKLCYLPITVHKMKRVEWYASWWQFLSGREAEQLAQLDVAEAARRPRGA